MAITALVSGGTATSSTSSNSLTFTTALGNVNASVRRFAVLVVASDNISAGDGDNSEITGITGGAGIWSKLGEYTNGEGAAAGGCTVSVWLFVPSGDNPTGTVFTIDFSASIVEKCATLHIFNHSAGNDIVADTDAGIIANATDASVGFGAATFSGLSSRERLYFRGLAKEASSTSNLTASSGFTTTQGARSQVGASAVLVRAEFRIATSTGETSDPTLAVTGDTAGIFAALIERPQNRTLTPDLFTNTQTFPAATVAPRYALTPSLLAEGQSFYGPGVSATAAILPGLLANATLFYAADVDGTPTIQPPLLDNSQAFYAATLVYGQSLAPTLVSSSASFPAPQIRSTARVAPGVLSNTSAFFGPSMVFSQIVDAGLFLNASAFPQTTVVRVPWNPVSAREAFPSAVQERDFFPRT